MKLDCNINKNGMGKYALIKLREAPEVFGLQNPALSLLAVPSAAVDYGNMPDSEFFVIRLKDKYAAAALFAYAHAAYDDGEMEWAEEVAGLADKAMLHNAKKKPD